MEDTDEATLAVIRGMQAELVAERALQEQQQAEDEAMARSMAREDGQLLSPDVPGNKASDEVVARSGEETVASPSGLGVRACSLRSAAVGDGDLTGEAGVPIQRTSYDKNVFLVWLLISLSWRRCHEIRKQTQS
jgi:hypothetical protein